MTPIYIFIDGHFHTTEQIMEKDILNYSPTVMFSVTPCIYIIFKYLGHKMSSFNYEFGPL